MEPRLLLSGSVLGSALGDYSDTIWTADEVAVLADEVTVVSGEIESATDNDYIKFIAPVTGGLRATMTDAGDGINSLLYLYDANYRRRASNNDMARGNPDACVEMFVEAGQTYYLRALGYRGTGRYDLSLVFSEDEDAAGFVGATSLTVNGDAVTVHDSSIDYYRDQDMFTFVAGDSGGLTIDMSALGSSIDSLLYVYNSAGRRIAVNNNVSRYDRNSRVTLAVEAGETYYVCALARGRVTGGYRLELDLAVDEEGNTPATATSISIDADAGLTVTGGIEYFRDYDMFTFVAAGDGGMLATMAGDASGVDSFLVMFDASGRRIAANNNYCRGSRDAQTAFLVEGGQRYYILATGLRRGVGEYELTLTHTLDEHGNDMDDATTVVVAAEGTTTVSEEIDYRYDRDYFRFVAPETGGLTINMNAADGSTLDSMIFVRNASGRYIAYNDDVARGNLDSQVNFYVQAGETYFVQARGWRRSVGAYDLSFALSVDEQGNVPAGAQTVTLDEDGNATVDSAIDYRSDVDYFAFTATQSAEMSVQMHNVSPAIRPYLAIYNSQGQSLTYGTSYYGGSTTVSFDASAGQTYYVRAASLSSGGGQYTLDFNLSVDDHSNSRSGATSLTINPNTPTTASGVIDYSYDHDYFTFTSAHSGGMVVTMQRATGSSLDAYLTIRDASGSVITYNDDSGGTLNSAVSFYVEAGATYYVQAHAYGTSQGAYHLELTLTADEYGGSFATAGTLTLDANGAGVVNGGLQFGGDNDYICFTATQTAEMSLSLTRTSGTVRPMLAIYSSSGQLLTTGVGTGSVPASVQFSSTEGATYYARIYSAGSTDTGNYRLAAQTTQPDPDPEPNPDLPDPTPGVVVTAAVYNTGSGLVLRVLGTNNDDIIIVSQTAGSVSVTGSASYTFNNVISSIELYGFNGDDVLRTTYSVTAGSLIYGGDGADVIYENGQGQGVSYGQGGDDRIVSIGGGADTVFGGTGNDSLWVDATDTLSDASGTEIATGRVHVVGEFYQPYTTNPSSGDYVSLEIAGQNFRDPTVSSTSYHYENYSNLDVFNNGPQYDDINQGSIGDCYFLAAVSSLSQTDPTIISEMVTALGDGTYAVRYYNGSTEEYLRIDGDLPTTSGGSLAYAKTSDTNEIWVPLIEKAYAHFRYGQDSYSSISGGWMDVVYRQVTGQSSEFRYTTGSTGDLASYLRNHLNAGHAVTLGSYSGASSPVVGSHAYQVVSIDSSNYVTVYNPWGVDGRSYDSNYNDGLLRLSINQIQSNYVGVCVSLA
ncbi:MAG: pre-peptidase C-terminal domain-containing protein [Phycisphaerae bacterium]|nr:pre-peptidase C-terminal domain-containing protein [Phycisphaerae bacterium]